MAGLLLADRTAGLEDKVREAEGRLAQVQAQLDSAPTKTSVERVEVPVIPGEVLASMEAIAKRTEGLADEIEAKAG